MDFLETSIAVAASCKLCVKSPPFYWFCKVMLVPQFKITKSNSFALATAILLNPMTNLHSNISERLAAAEILLIYPGILPANGTA